jgi:hypothetical protein
MNGFKKLRCEFKCSVRGCPLTIHYNKKCIQHLSQINTKNKKRKCKFPECSSMNWRKGYCKFHFKWYLEDNRCTSCDNIVYANGLCKDHYKEIIITCIKEECLNPIFSIKYSLCRSHYYKTRRIKKENKEKKIIDILKKEHKQEPD